MIDDAFWRRASDNHVYLSGRNFPLFGILSSNVCCVFAASMP